MKEQRDNYKALNTFVFFFLRDVSSFYYFLEFDYEVNIATFDPR